MADRWAVANGNWSNTATWNGGTLPTAADDVFADGFTVTINQNVTVLSVRTTQRTGGTAGGGFPLNAGFTLTANVIAGTTTCVFFNAASPNSATIVGNLTGGTSVNAYGASNDSTGTLTIIGNCTGGANINTSAAWNAGGGIMNITGNCTGGTSTGGIAARNLVNSTMTITGNCIGGLAGAGAANSSTGTITVIGSAIGGTGGTAHGVSNDSTGTVNIIRAVGNGFGLGSVGLVSLPGVFSAQSSITNVQEIEYGNLGQSPTSGPIRLTDLTTNKAIFYRPSLTKKTLVDQAASGGMPSASNVRSGTSFNFGNTTGTLAVPAPNQVAVGVPVDNTVGTAVLTVANVQSILNASIVPAATVSRSQSDMQPINFAWPTTGATITATVSINNGSFVPTVGTVSFLRTETTGKHIYSLSYNAADRPSSEGQARYVLTDGSHTRSFSLSVQNIAVKNISVEDNSITID